jgi:hypothetical protein
VGNYATKTRIKEEKKEDNALKYKIKIIFAP